MSRTDLPSARIPGWIFLRLCPGLLALLIACCAGPTEPKDSPPDPPPTPTPRKEDPAVTGVRHVYSGRTLELRGDLEGAIRAYREARSADPSSALLTRSLARVLAKAKRGGESLQILNQFLATHPDKKTHGMLIDLLDRLERREEADREADRLLGQRPLPIALARALSERALRLGNIPKAGAFLGAALAPESDPSFPQVLAGEFYF
ncbi:MAG: tetratricopeptide repeat protein, partial [Planctomycetota bacterium]